MSKLIQIKNRSAGTTVYTIPELGDKRNIRREFAPHEVKNVDLEEVKALTFVPGGDVLLNDYLQVLDESVWSEINLNPEIEYSMSEEDVKNMLISGSYERLLDCLDFAPDGVIDLIKTYAIELPLNDSSKRAAIKEKTGFDIDKALLRIRESQEEDVSATTAQKQRRVPVNNNNKATPQYNIVK